VRWIVNLSRRRDRILPAPCRPGLVRQDRQAQVAVRAGRCRHRWKRPCWIWKGCATTYPFALSPFQGAGRVQAGHRWYGAVLAAD